MTGNVVTNNTDAGVYLQASSYGVVNGYLRSNVINSNSIGVSAYADSSYGSVNLTMLYNQVNSNTYTGVYLYADTDAYAYAFLKNNSIVGNYTGVFIYGSDHSSAGHISATLSRNFIASNYWAGMVVDNTSTAYIDVFLKNNIFYNNATTGLYVSDSSGSSVYVNAGPYGAKTGLNTFNNPTNIVNGVGANLVLTNNWWPVNDAYASPLDIPLLCTATVAGSVVTVTASSASTYFVDKVGAAPKRLTMTVDGVAATGVAVAAGQTSVTGTAAWATSSSAIVVTNAGGQVCTVTPVVVVASGGGGSSNSPPYDATGGGTDWLYYPEDAQTNVPTGTVIKWTELTDANGDTITYTLYLCHKDDWDSDANDCTNWIAITGITANASALRQAQGDMVMTANAAGAAGATALFAIGFIGAMRSRKGRAFMMALMMIASAGMIASCSTDSDDDTTDSATTYTVCTDEAGIICEDIESSYTLDANTEYHWYVNASDGNGGSTNSDTRSFTTGD